MRVFFLSILTSLLATYHVAGVMYLIPLLITLLLQLASTATTLGSASQPSLFSNTANLNLNTTTATGANTSASSFQYLGPADAGPKVKCDRIYGSNMDRGSCFDAWQRFRWKDTRPQLFAQRGTADKIEQVLPKRISSSMSLFTASWTFRAFLFFCSTFGNFASVLFFGEGCC